MKKFSFSLFSLVCALSMSAAQAGSVYFAGDVGVITDPSKTQGIINVFVDLEPGQTMANGGITLTVRNDNPAGAVAFTEAAVLNPGGRWTIAADTTTPGDIQFNSASILTPGLPAGGQGVIFATINWTKTGPGSSNLAFDLLPETFVDGDNGDVTSSYTAVNNFVSFVPEPGTLAMAGMSLIGLAFRRRNG